MTLFSEGFFLQHRLDFGAKEMGLTLLPKIMILRMLFATSNEKTQMQLP